MTSGCACVGAYFVWYVKAIIRQLDVCVLEHILFGMDIKGTCFCSSLTFGCAFLCENIWLVWEIVVHLAVAGDVFDGVF